MEKGVTRTQSQGRTSACWTIPSHRQTDFGVVIYHRWMEKPEATATLWLLQLLLCALDLQPSPLTRFAFSSNFWQGFFPGCGDGVCSSDTCDNIARGRSCDQGWICCRVKKIDGWTWCCRGGEPCGWRTDGGSGFAVGSVPLRVGTAGVKGVTAIVFTAGPSVEPSGVPVTAAGWLQTTSGDMRCPRIPLSNMIRFAAIGKENTLVRVGVAEVPWPSRSRFLGQEVVGFL
ncbi:hypothetical protein NE237_017234 [Protea cynaroides]|uniref:Uncharacterized protein n=1 Tax=Protea cynaroides TaxID=273540 RepID=A0A9Q0QMQ5_9MAGN|nr:hypothetical protein NE237_017234 [Protea cynaroides]